MYDNGLESRIHEAGYMVSEIVSGAARSGNHDLAALILNWAKRLKIFTNAEEKALVWYCRLTQWRMLRFTGLQRWICRGIKDSKHIEGSIGKVPLSEPAIVS
jgi:hypothetical protein